MAATTKLAGNSSSSRLSTAHTLTALIIVPAAVAAAGGLLIPGLYRDHPALVPVLQGQDLVTLIALPVLLFSLLVARRGSARGTIAWIGLLGYMLYTYTGAAFAYSFNHFLPIYIALFSMAAFALVAAVSSIDAAALKGRFDAAAPRRPVAAFLVLIAAMLGPAELSQIIPFYTSGALPGPMVKYQSTTFFVYTLDLGMVVPLSVLAAVWLWRGSAWGFVLAGCMLIKGATMGFALLSMEGFALRAGYGTDGLEGLWAVIAFGCLGMAIWFLRHCRDQHRDEEVRGSRDEDRA